MTEFLLYIGRSGLYLGIFYAFYLLVMRHTTFFRLNRCVLLAGSAACALLPLLKLREAAAGAGPLTGLGQPAAAAATDSAVSWPMALAAVYFAGLLTVILFTLFSAARMLRLMKSGESRLIEGYWTRVLEGDTPSFSFGKTIVIGRNDLEENPAIFTHEKMHVKYRHYLDLFIFRIIQTVWWWNPLVWITRTELGLLHEYEADEAVLKAGVEARQYQMLLVRKAVGDERFVLASGFQHASLKSRIAMMLKEASPKRLGWSYLAVIPFLALAVYACNPAKTQAPEPDFLEDEARNTYGVLVVDEAKPNGLQASFVKPTFKGGDLNSFSFWVNEHLNYPESAKAAGIQGRIVLGFTVGTDGRMKDIRVLRGVHPTLDAEALRVLESCTEPWTPALQDGQPVEVKYTFPVIFQLR